MGTFLLALCKIQNSFKIQTFSLKKIIIFLHLQKISRPGNSAPANSAKLRILTQKFVYYPIAARLNKLEYTDKHYIQVSASWSKFHMLSSDDFRLIFFLYKILSFQRRIRLPSTAQLLAGGAYSGSPILWSWRFFQTSGPRLRANSTFERDRLGTGAQDHNEKNLPVRCRGEIQGTASGWTHGLTLVSTDLWKTHRYCHKGQKFTRQRQYCAHLWTFRTG